jgi:chemotaxis protein MotA
MDITTIFGLILGIGAVLVSFIMEGGHISSLIQAPAMLLVICGTFGAATITTSSVQLMSLPKLFKVILFEKKLNSQQLIDLIYDLAQKSRKNGLLSLEKELPTIGDSFLKKAIQLAIDGFETNKIREILEIEMSYIEERHKVGATFFQKLGGFSPTLGIIGTVLGLIHALGNMENSSNMAASIASAFIATLWGVALANLIYLPISDKLKVKHQDEALYLEIISEGVISLAMGDNPRVIRMKLLSFLLPNNRNGGDDL